MEGPEIGLKPLKSEEDYEKLVTWARKAEKPWKNEGLGPPLTPEQRERMDLSVLDALPDPNRKKKLRAMKQIQKTLKKLQVQVSNLEAL